MSTTLYLVTAGDISRGTQDTMLSGAASYWRQRGLRVARGASATSLLGDAVAGPTDGVEAGFISGSGAPVEWFSLPFAADTTISGTITLNLRASESSSTVNAAINAIIERMGPTGSVISTIAQTSRTTELGTSESANNFTVSPTSTTLQKGDRLRVRVYVDDSVDGNMAASSGSIAFYYDGPTGAASGDSYLTFTEDFSFASDPAGTVLYLTDTAGPAVGSATEREMWTSRGAGVQTDVVNTAAGPISPTQWTDTAGGAVVEWYSKPLAAFTLADKAVATIRALESNALANVGLRAELAVCDGDGSNVVVWAAANYGTDAGIVEAGTSETALPVALAADDLAVTAGQRLRLRAYIDDTNAAQATGYTATLYYAGTSGGASGDSYLTLAQSVSEFTIPVVNVYPDADTTTTGWTSTPLWSKVDEDPASPDGTTITATSA